MGLFENRIKASKVLKLLCDTNNVGALVCLDFLPMDVGFRRARHSLFRCRILYRRL